MRPSEEKAEITSTSSLVTALYMKVGWKRRSALKFSPYADFSAAHSGRERNSRSEPRVRSEACAARSAIEWMPSAVGAVAAHGERIGVLETERAQHLDMVAGRKRLGQLGEQPGARRSCRCA